MQWRERISVGMIAGLVAGFAVLGVGGRLAMRLVSIADGKPGRFTIGGTFFVLMIFSVFGVILSIPFATLQKYLPTSGLRKGATFGALLMLVIVWVMPLVPYLAGGRADEISLSWMVARALFSVLFLAYGVIVASVSERLHKIEAL